MCSKYSKSRKATHRIFLKYVGLKIEELEQTRQQVAVTAPASSTSLPAELNKTQGYPKLKLQAKSKAKSKAAAVPSSTMKTNLEETSDLSESVAADVQALQSRMLNMESALQQIDHCPPDHPEGRSVSEPDPIVHAMQAGDIDVELTSSCE